MYNYELRVLCDSTLQQDHKLHLLPYDKRGQIVGDIL